MNNFTRGSSSIYRIELHVGYKVKYSRKVFDIAEVKERCEQIFYEVAALIKVEIKEIGFESDHVHMDIFMTRTQRPCDIDKSFKGVSGRKLLKEFPILKQKYFWGSGFWGGQVYEDSLGRNPDEVRATSKTKAKNTLLSR
jgi:putative transposase